MSCSHPTITAGVLTHEGRAAVVRYCHDCTIYVYQAKGKAPLRVSANLGADLREEKALEWLGAE